MNLGFSRNALFILLIFSSDGVFGDIVVDQSSEQIIDSPGFVGAPNRFAQTFTAGVEGQLVAVDLYVGKGQTTADDLLFDIRTLSGSLPTQDNSGSNVLFSVTKSASEVDTTEGWITFDTEFGGIFVSPGDQLAIVLRSNTPNDEANRYRWYQSGFDNPYAGGREFFTGFDGNWTDEFAENWDFTFRTYVSTTAVPEPSLGFLLLSCIGGVMFRRRSRQVEPCHVR